MPDFKEMFENVMDVLNDPLDEHGERAAKAKAVHGGGAERAAVIAFLRAHPTWTADALAGAIERNEHRT